MVAAVALRPRQTTRQTEIDPVAPRAQQPATVTQLPTQAADNTVTRDPVSPATQAGARQAAQARVATASHRISGSYVPAPSMDQVRAGQGQLRRGQQGESVAELQTRLNASGAKPPLDTDGKFGPKTQDALRTYQKSRDITDTGVLGKTTLGALDASRPAVTPQANTPATTPEATTPARTNGATNVDTSKMTEAQKYDHYKGLIEQNGGKFKSGPNERNIISLRTETSTKANGGQGVYDDKTAMLWTDKNGGKHVKEYKSNTEPSSRYEGRYGEDVNRDGRLDLGRMRPGSYEFRTGSSSTLGNVLRPTKNMTVDRDTNHDGRISVAERAASKRRGDVGYGINIHWGDSATVGGWSLGCQVIKGSYGAFRANVTPIMQLNQGQMYYTLVDRSR